MRSVCGAGRQGGCCPCSLQCTFALSPSLPARAQGHGGTSVSLPGVVVAVEEGEQHAPPLSSTGAVYLCFFPVAHSPLKIAERL